MNVYLIQRESDGKFLGTRYPYPLDRFKPWTIWAWTKRGTKRHRNRYRATQTAKKIASLRDAYDLPWGKITVIEEVWEATSHIPTDIYF
jgi:hypothetical protein